MSVTQGNAQRIGQDRCDGEECKAHGAGDEAVFQAQPAVLDLHETRQILHPSHSNATNCNLFTLVAWIRFALGNGSAEIEGFSASFDSPHLHNVPKSPMIWPEALNRRSGAPQPRFSAVFAGETMCGQGGEQRLTLNMP